MIGWIRFIYHHIINHFTPHMSTNFSSKKVRSRLKHFKTFPLLARHPIHYIKTLRIPAEQLEIINPKAKLYLIEFFWIDLPTVL